MTDLIRAMGIACDVVMSAGKIIRDRMGGVFSTSYKTCPADLVTEVDKESQAIILEGLEKSFPGHRLVAEEDFAMEDPELDERPVWFIDPLDGTTNFVFGIPFCAVTVSLALDGHPVLGVTYDPARFELFTAIKGNGSYLNGKRVRVDHTRKKIAESLINTGFPTADRFKGQMLSADFKTIFSTAIDVRSLGSAALELAYIACGRLTGYWEVTLRPWDVAAGMVLVGEAGGRVSGLCGEPLEINNYMSIVASNGHIHSELISGLGFAGTRINENDRY